MPPKSHSGGPRNPSSSAGPRNPLANHSRNDPRRVLIVDDHGFFANGLTSLINNEDDIEVCGQCAHLDGVQAAVEESNPDLVILDVSVAGENSLELANMLRARRPGLRFMFLSSFPGGILQEHAKTLKPKAVIEKTQDPVSILRAIRRALRH